MPYSSEEIPSHRLVLTPMNLWRHSRELRKVRTATKAAQIDHQENQSAWRLRIHDLVRASPLCEYLRIWWLLYREGWLVNRTRVRQLYRL